jgi:hypothetical protein
MSNKLYTNGDVVEITGKYLCLACGNILMFKKGEIFTECNSCFAGTAEGLAGYTEGVDFWKLMGE